ncbi:DUF4189 domain-containing protein [Pseudomonas sessilinigenes]|uniref:DUF4189 domain-containing protein n=2 Tax=Pseudomonas sessilinigenes TaxID=658629 RepID=A0ABX8MHJ9_9PSED|nr:DUF4189 domain-containing protein [Pseudomonas sessilinigenes]
MKSSMFGAAPLHWANLLLLLALAFPAIAHAEGRCPAGQYPIGDQGVGGCAPIPGAGGSPREQEPAGQWHKTWGAIASSGATADAGVAVNRPSKESAEKFALSDCSRRGAPDCKVIFTYRNQCVAWMVPSSKDGTSRSGLGSAKDPEEARIVAQQGCVDTGGKACQVVYEDCTKPVYEAF